tara:strand:- start:410 stop:541 length:132 start_codon:yes stop_codon:yes gene_type:complete
MYIPKPVFGPDAHQQFAQNIEWMSENTLVSSRNTDNMTESFNM